MKFLLTGGCGYIASHTAIALLKQGHNVVLVDDFLNSYPQTLAQIQKISNKKPIFYQLNLLNEKKLQRVFQNHKFDAVLHFAALKAIQDSINSPLLYYQNNLSGSIVLFQLMQKFHVHNIVFSSTAAVYGVDKDDSNGLQINSPTRPTNPYGKSKLMIEQVLADLPNNACPWKIVVLRYFNPVGAHPSALLGEVPRQNYANLLPRLFQVALGKIKQISVFGDDYPTSDGTCIRDYLHIMDLAQGHVLALDKIKTMQPNKILFYNLGTGKGTSVLEMIHAVQNITQKNIPYLIAPRRPGDVAYCFTNPQQAQKELGFKTTCTLQNMIASGWNFYKNYPDGYNS